ncbi:hypothetical protein B0H19DRAFT_1276228 [Mycena capillaripes]|nr:hypothetical protein B0H19DRAFT_1276228 [Mycena capillaripes]
MFSRVHIAPGPDLPHRLPWSLPPVSPPSLRLETSGGPIRYSESYYNLRPRSNRQQSTLSLPLASQCPVAMHGVQTESPSCSRFAPDHLWTSDATSLTLQNCPPLRASPTPYQPTIRLLRTICPPPFA